MMYLMPEGFVLLMASLVLLGGERKVEGRMRPTGFAYYGAQAAMLLAFVATLYGAPSHRVVLFDGQFVLDHLVVGLKCLMAASGLLVFLYGRDYVKQQAMPETEYYALALFSFLGMMLLVSSANLFSLFLSLECMSLPVYAMVALRRSDVHCIEAAIKYFVVGALASALLLLGMSFVFGATGAFNLFVIAQHAATLGTALGPMLVVGLVLMLAGIVFKLGAAPFHMWVPDVYEGAPTSVVLFISAAPKLAAFALLTRVLTEALPTMGVQWHMLLLWVAVASMALGNIMALVQANLKRLLAYSSVAHMGYALLAFSTATAYGEEAALFYFIAYVVMALGAFGVITLLSSDGKEVQSLNDLKGLHQRNPWLAFLMLLILFSMAGIPPIVGFIAKLRILESLIQIHEVGFAALAILFAIIGAYYYLKMVKAMYFEEAEDTTPFVYTRSKALAISLNGGLVLWLGVLPASLFSFCHWMLG